MKYFEFTFRTQPCTETVNDVLAAIPVSYTHLTLPTNSIV